jgi:hypothetical protein
VSALKDVEWLWPHMGQYRSTMNDMSKVIGEIRSERARDLAAKDTLREAFEKVLS